MLAYSSLEQGNSSKLEGYLCEAVKTTSFCLTSSVLTESAHCRIRRRLLNT